MIEFTYEVKVACDESVATDVEAALNKAAKEFDSNASVEETSQEDLDA